MKMESKTIGRVPNRAAVGWKSPNSSISSNSSTSTSDEALVYTLPTRAVKAPSPTSKSFNQTISSGQQYFHTISHHQMPPKSSDQVEIQKSTSEKLQRETNCKKSPMLRRMKLALAEAEDKNRMNNFPSTNQNDSRMILVNNSTNKNPLFQSSSNESSTNPNSTISKSLNHNPWQNSTKKGTVEANEDFEFQGFPKPPPQFFPPPPSNASPSPSSPLVSPARETNNDLQDHHPIEIKRIPLKFKASSPKSPDYKNEKSCVLDELKQKQESGITGNGPIYKKNRSPMLRRMKLALAHIESDL